MLKKDLVLGNKYKVVISTPYFPQDSVVIYHRDDGSDTPVFKRADGQTAHMNVCKVAELNTVEDAEIALKKAREEVSKAEYALSKAEYALSKAEYALSKAIGEKEALNKFTEADIKNLMIVSLYSKEDPYDANDLRLVVLTKDTVYFNRPDGGISNTLKRSEIVSILNHVYFKTNKTLKDFADA